MIALELSNSIISAVLFLKTWFLTQATKALTKEARRVKTFLLQQAIRKSKVAAEKREAKAGTTRVSPRRRSSGAAVAAEEALVGDKEEEDSDGGEAGDGGDGDSSETPPAADVHEGDNSSVGVSPAPEEVLLIKVWLR